MHVPPYDPRGGRHQHFLPEKASEKLIKLFRKYAVTHIFASHIHGYFEGKWGDIPFTITGGAGATLRGYEHRSIFFLLAIIFVGAFWLMGSTIGRYKEEKLRQVNRLFWITILAALLTELASEEIIKDAVMRPRPLSDAYAVYNKEIRTVADEIVRGGNSYVAGHSAAFFAMITPMIYFASKRWLKAGLLLWALVHAFTRVYLAAHFPYCSLMGALFGFSMATLVVKIFGVSENGREPFVKDYTRNLLSPILHAIFGVEFKSE